MEDHRSLKDGEPLRCPKKTTQSAGTSKNIRIRGETSGGTLAAQAHVPALPSTSVRHRQAVSCRVRFRHNRDKQCIPFYSSSFLFSCTRSLSLSLLRSITSGSCFLGGAAAFAPGLQPCPLAHGTTPRGSDVAAAAAPTLAAYPQRHGERDSASLSDTVIFSGAEVCVLRSPPGPHDASATSPPATVPTGAAATAESGAAAGATTAAGAATAATAGSRAAGEGGASEAESGWSTSLRAVPSFFSCRLLHLSSRSLFAASACLRALSSTLAGRRRGAGRSAGGRRAASSRTLCQYFACTRRARAMSSMPLALASWPCGSVFGRSPSSTRRQASRPRAKASKLYPPSTSRTVVATWATCGHARRDQQVKTADG